MDWARSWTLLVLMGSAASLACSASDEPKPAEVCQQFVSSFCAKAVSCARETDRGDFSELCDFSFRVYLPCEQVTRVWGNAQTCQDQIAAIRCTDVVPGSFPQSPSACQGLFGIE
jgi:hypothetical protein